MSGVSAVVIPLAAALLAAVALLWLRRRGWVTGVVREATAPRLAPFVRQKTILPTTYRRDGRPGATPASIAVDGDHAYVRSSEKALKTRRIRCDPRVLVAPSTGRGRPTGEEMPARARLLDGEENRRAARLLRRKYPVPHGIVVPLAHRMPLRAKTGRTVHFSLVPDGRVEPGA